MKEEQILCACSAYEQKYYFNPRYAALPQQIQEELPLADNRLELSFRAFEVKTLRFVRIG